MSKKLYFVYGIVGLSVLMIVLTLGIIARDDPFEQPIPDPGVAPDTITGSFHLSFNLSERDNCENVDGFPEYINDSVKEGCVKVTSQDGSHITLEGSMNGKEERLTGEVRGNTMIFQKQENLTRGDCSLDYSSSIVIPTHVTSFEQGGETTTQIYIDNASEVIVLDMNGECVGLRKVCKAKFAINELEEENR